MSLSGSRSVSGLAVAIPASPLFRRGITGAPVFLLGNSISCRAGEQSGKADAVGRQGRVRGIWSAFYWKIRWIKVWSVSWPFVSKRRIILGPAGPMVDPLLIYYNKRFVKFSSTSVIFLVILCLDVERWTSVQFEKKLFELWNSNHL